jgi:hypothetical protein
MELDVLRGAQRTIAAHGPWCWIEYWMSDRGALKAQLAGLGYRFYLVDQLNMLCAPDHRVSAQRIVIKLEEDRTDDPAPPGTLRPGA